MIFNLSVLVGLACGGALAWVVRGREGGSRARAGLGAGVLILMVLTGWAWWQDEFPGTFGPFVVICAVVSLTQRKPTTN